jgi:hypothetical protein
VKIVVKALKLVPRNIEEDDQGACCLLAGESKDFFITKCAFCLLAGWVAWLVGAVGVGRRGGVALAGWVSSRLLRFITNFVSFLVSSATIVL